SARPPAATRCSWTPRRTSPAVTAPTAARRAPTSRPTGPGRRPRPPRPAEPCPRSACRAAHDPGPPGPADGRKPHDSGGPVAYSLRALRSRRPRGGCAVPETAPAAQASELESERRHLAQSRAALARMREKVSGLQAHGGDGVSTEYLKAALWRRMKALEDDPDIPLFFGRLDTEPEAGRRSEERRVGNGRR